MQTDKNWATNFFFKWTAKAPHGQGQGMQTVHYILLMCEQFEVERRSTMERREDRIGMEQHQLKVT